MPIYVFVYGSLRQGEINDLTQAALRHGCNAPRWIAQGHVAGRLYDMGAWPALVAGSSGQVLGDVYEVDAALLAVMDDIEEYVPGSDSTYLRETVVVRTPQGGMTCQYYPVLPHKLAGAEPVQAEDWVRYRRERDQS